MKIEQAEGISWLVKYIPKDGGKVMGMKCEGQPDTATVINNMGSDIVRAEICIEYPMGMGFRELRKVTTITREE